MKNKIVSSLFVLLGICLLSFAGRPASAQDELGPAPLNPAFVQYQQGLQEGILPQAAAPGGGYGLGYIPPPLDLSAFKGLKIDWGKSLLGLIPTSYDLRTLNRLTSVKDQGIHGTCWAFGTYGSMESCLMPGESRDFSENNLVNLAGFDYGYEGGGTYLMSTAYLARWSGPVNESDDPYNSYSSPNSSPSGLTIQKHVQNVLFLPNRSGSLDNDNIKQAVMTYGAVGTSFYWNGPGGAGPDYNPATEAYYYSGAINTNFNNHAVCIVGWDDSFSRSNFNTTPSGDGAFIVKNSWGTSWGQSGYFYVSYYDTNFGADNTVFYDADSVDNYRSVYQYDPLGLVNYFGNGTNVGWGADIFTASSNQLLDAVGLYAAVPSTAYQIYVYTNVNAGQPTNGNLSGTKTGTIAFPGYRTIVLDTPVSLASGQRFSVVVSFTTPGSNYSIPAEYPLAGYSSHAAANPGESFMSSNGTTWTDATAVQPNASVCLKAFTSVITHNIGASAGSHGSISPSGTVTVDDGVDQAFTISPNPTYRLASLLVDGSAVDTQIGRRTGYTFNAVTADHTIAASFEVTPLHTIHASAGTHGTISPSGDVSIAEGDTPSFTIRPETGYYLASLLVDGTAVDTQSGRRTSYTFAPVMTDHTIAASFAWIPVWNVSGKVSLGTTAGGVGNVLLTVSGGSFSENAVTDTDGNFLLASVPAGGTYTLTPQKTGFTFQPAQIILTNLQANALNQNFAAYLQLVFTDGPSGSPNPVSKGGTVRCSVAATQVLGAGWPVSYSWVVTEGKFEDTGTTVSSLQNPRWVADITMPSGGASKLVDISVTVTCDSGTPRTASFTQQVDPASDSGGGGGGSDPVGPLAAVVSGLLVLLKRKGRREER